MRRLAALCLLLAACASRDPPQVQACEARASDDPEVRRLQADSAGSETFAVQHRRDLVDARQQATLRCLRAHSFAPPGGVEQPRRDPNLFDGLF